MVFSILIVCVTVVHVDLQVCIYIRMCRCASIMGIGICLCQCPEWIAVSLFTVSGLLILRLLATIGVYSIYTPPTWMIHSYFVLS